MDNPNSQGLANQAAQVQQQVADAPQMPETRRRLNTANYSANSTVSIDIPRDTGVKRIELFGVAGFTTTFASGSPVYSPMGLFARICPTFYIVADGSRNVKVLDLYMQRCLNALGFGGFPRRAYQKGNGILATTDQPTTEWLAGSVAFSTTTQDTVLNEVVDIEFENPFCYDKGKSLSMLYTKNLSTCSMYFGFSNVSNLLDDGNTATVTYSAVNVAFTPTIIEQRDAVPANNAFDYVETVIRKQYSSQTTLTSIDLNTGNKLLGLGIMVQDGDTNKSLSNVAVTDLNLLLNGSTGLQQTKFRELQNDNKTRFGVSDDQFASSVSGLKGFAFMNLISHGDILSGLDTRLVNGVSQVQLQISTASASGVNAATYTNPVQVSILQQQLIPVAPKA